MQPVLKRLAKAKNAFCFLNWFFSSLWGWGKRTIQLQRTILDSNGRSLQIFTEAISGLKCSTVWTHGQELQPSFTKDGLSMAQHHPGSKKGEEMKATLTLPNGRHISAVPAWRVWFTFSVYTWRQTVSSVVWLRMTSGTYRCSKGDYVFFIAMFLLETQDPTFAKPNKHFLVVLQSQQYLTVQTVQTPLQSYGYLLHYKSSYFFHSCNWRNTELFGKFFTSSC